MLIVTDISPFFNHYLYDAYSKIFMDFGN